MPDFDVSKIWELIPDRLYQGGLSWSRGEAEISLPRDYSFDCVLSLTSIEPLPGVEEHDVWAIRDAGLPDESTLHRKAKKVVRWIREGKTSLVHCAEGINRSSLVNGLALAYHHGISGAEAVRRIREVRPRALSNPNFLRYLQNQHVLDD